MSETATKKTRTNAMAPLMPLIYEAVLRPCVQAAIADCAKHSDQPTLKNVHRYFCDRVGCDVKAIPESSFREWFNKLGYKIERTPTLVAPVTTSAAE